jgi:hypothetical protein
MTVYVIKRAGVEDGLYKIGFTADLNRRMAEFSTSTPGGMAVVKNIGGGRDLEARLHERFSASRSSGEWFRLTANDLDEINSIADEEEPGSGHGTATPAPEDEFSDNIVTETRFYLNELVRSEWRGMGDTAEMARDRVAAEVGIERSYAFRIWNKPQEMSDISGTAYRSLRLAYATMQKFRGCINPNQQRFLDAIYRSERMRAVAA